MRIGKRLFPYPILNNAKLYSHFKDSIFELKYDELITDENYSMQNIHCDITSEYLKQLVLDGKANVIIVVECASTMFRKTYNIGLLTQNISIPVADLNGKISVSAYIVATQDIDNYSSNEFLDDYEGYEFSVEKNDILAVDDGYVNKVDFDDETDNKKSSIFLVIKDKTIKDETMKVDYDTSKINIYLPEEQWNMYDKTKRIGKFQSLYFSILAVPALVYSIQEVRRTGALLDQIRMDYKWFNAFLVSYNELNGEELLDEDFMTMDVNIEAQKLLNTPITKSLDDIFGLAMGSFGGSDDAD